MANEDLGWNGMDAVDAFGAAETASAQPCLWPVHGGPDAHGAAQHDFSTNSNACGPCPHTLAAVQQADATRYPDPAYTALRAQLAAFHGVVPSRIVLAASASEFIHRITALAAQQGARAVALPAHSYGDYAQAAQARGLQVLRPADAGWDAAGLHWACEPSSPLGRADPALAAVAPPLGEGGVEGQRHWSNHSAAAVDLSPHQPPARGLRRAPIPAFPQRREEQSRQPSQHENALAPRAALLRVLDCAYMPLRLHTGRAFDLPGASSAIWQLWTPNKALGLTGVRAAYAIAPCGADAAVATLNALAPSWPVGAHGLAMLESWAKPATQRWLADCLPVLRDWKAQQIALCTDLGWAVLPGSQANYFCAQPGVPDVPAALQHLRHHGIKVRDCASFGLPGVLRLGVLPPAAQAALRQAWLPMSSD